MSSQVFQAHTHSNNNKQHTKIVYLQRVNIGLSVQSFKQPIARQRDHGNRLTQVEPYHHTFGALLKRSRIIIIFARTLLEIYAVIHWRYRTIGVVFVTHTIAFQPIYQHQ